MTMLEVAQYRVDIFDDDGKRVAVLESASFASFSYDIIVNDVGRLALSVQINHPVVAVVLRDYVAQVVRYNPSRKIWEDEAAYLIKLFEPFQDEQGAQYMMYGGVSLEFLLQARIIDPDDDPLAANGYSTKDGAAESIMHAYVTEQLGPSATAARQVGLVMGTDNGRGSSEGYRRRHDRLLELLQDISRRGSVDFRVVWLNNAPTFQTWIGRPKTNTTDQFLFFSIERGNMINPRLTRDFRQEQNFCYALGDGEGENRDVYKVSSSAATATKYSRYEFVFNASEAEDAADILGQAQLAIIRNLAEESLTFEIGPTSKYRVHWILGDYVRAGYQGFESNVRITGISVSLSDGKEDIQPTVEVWN